MDWPWGITFISTAMLAQLTDGKVFAIGRTLNGSFETEVYWTRQSLFDVHWPFEVTRYNIVWPNDPQILVRGSMTIGSPVVVPEALQATLLADRELLGGAGFVDYDLAKREFNMFPEGFAVLRYEAGGEVWFETIRSVLNNDAAYFDREEVLWDIPLELKPQYPNWALAAEAERALEVYPSADFVSGFSLGVLVVDRKCDRTTFGV